MEQSKLLESKKAKAILGFFLLITAVLTLLRLVNLDADMPSNITSSATLYGDEGTYASNALKYFYTGNWYVIGDFNYPVHYPVYFVLEVIVFKLFGASFETVRAISAVSAVLVIFTIWLIVQPRVSNLAAAITTFLISSNYLFFAFSRYGQADIPTLLFVVLSLACLLLGKTTPASWRTILSALLLVCAILTKTTAVFAIPVLLVLIWQQQQTAKNRAIHLAIFLGIISLIFTVYYILLVKPYFADYQRIATSLKYRFYNTVNAILLSFWKQFKFGSYKISRLVYASALISGLFLLVSWKEIRDKLLVMISLVWLASGSFVLSLSSYQPPRYFSHLVVPLAILVGIGIDHLIRVNRVKEMCIIGYLMLGIVLFASLQGIVKITQYMVSPQYSMYRMSEDIHRQIEAEKIPLPLLLGSIGQNVTLANGLPSVGGAFVYGLDTDLLLKYHHPTHYLTLGPVVNSRSYILTKAGYQLKLIKKYDVLNNYVEGRQVHLYQMLKKR